MDCLDFCVQVRISRFLPLTILGILALIGGVVGLMLPETLGAILPETIEDGENFGKDQSFWQFPCCGQPSRFFLFSFWVAIQPITQQVMKIDI